MGFAFRFAGCALVARPSGALYWPERRCLIVSDLHLGRSERYARLNRGLLPPYENDVTIEKLAREIEELAPEEIIFLGDSFDDERARLSLEPQYAQWLESLLQGRATTWITGNHDDHIDGDGFLGGRMVDELDLELRFRHIRGEGPDVSGHYHPVLRVAGRRWRCFALTQQHLIMPAFGGYTGGLELSDPAYAPWLGKGYALVCGATVFPVPLP